jgi:exopolyphosphatase/pppGpp-phosphohydrolase
MDALAMQTEVLARYRALRALVPKAKPMVLLNIGADHTALAVGHELGPPATLVLAIGSQKTAREFFKHAPPSPLEIEDAIQTVEDEVIRARALLPTESVLVTSDVGIREIALHSGVADAALMRLPLESMERTFDRFASVSSGRPAVQEGLPATASFAATLLILREFMHHMRFSEIAIAGAPKSK